MIRESKARDRRADLARAAAVQDTPPPEGTA